MFVTRGLGYGRGDNYPVVSRSFLQELPANLLNTRKLNSNWGLWNFLSILSYIESIYLYKNKRTGLDAHQFQLFALSTAGRADLANKKGRYVPRALDI